MTETINQQTVDALQDLLTRAYDAEQGFEQAAEAVDHPRLAELFRDYSQQRRSFGKDIKNLIRQHGEEPDKGASMMGKLHQFWISMRGKLSDGSEGDLIEECRRGEETTMADYQNYIDDENVALAARELFTDQLMQVREIYARLSSLEEAAVAVDATRPDSVAR